MTVQDAIVTLTAATAAWWFARKVFAINRAAPSAPPQCATCPQSAKCSQ